MIVNPYKFQEIVLKKGSKNKGANNNKINIENIKIVAITSAELSGIKLDNKLNFQEHTSVLCKKVSLQLNAINRFQKYMRNKEKEAILNSFTYSFFKNCALVSHFRSCKLFFYL